MKRLILSSFLLFTLIGCTSHRELFVEVVQDHRDLSQETIPAVIESIKDDLKNYPDLSEEDRQAIGDLILRLELIQYGSRVIADYVNSEMSNQAIQARLLKARWDRRFE